MSFEKWCLVGVGLLIVGVIATGAAVLLRELDRCYQAELREWRRRERDIKRRRDALDASIARGCRRTDGRI